MPNRLSQRRRHQARLWLKYLRDSPIPLIAFISVAAVQLLSLKYAPVAAFTRSYLGAFIQGVVITVTFGGAASQTLRALRKQRFMRNLFGTLMAHIQESGEPECEELKTAFHSLDLLKHLERSNLRSIHSIGSDECAIFVLGYQFYGHALTLEDFDAGCLTEIARTAADCDEYRRIITTLALTYVVPFDEAVALADEIEGKATTRFAVSSKAGEADLRLEAKLAQAQAESLLIVGTTSQHSGFSSELLTRHSNRISNVMVIHLSPRILTHAALSAQSREAEVPKVVIPSGQQTRDSVVDMIRRVIRILVGVENVRVMLTSVGVPITALGLTEGHLGAKIRALRTYKYMQMFPGPLKYAGNLYRFGYEISDSRLVEHLLNIYDARIADSAHSVTSDLEFDTLQRCSLAELGRWMTGLPRIVERLSAQHKSLLELLPENRARAMLQSAMDVLAAGIEATQSPEGTPIGIREHKIFIPTVGAMGADPRVILSGNELGHVSAGVLVLKDQHLLVVRKTTAPNVGRWSIPAGHCVWGESVYLAARRELQEEVGVVSDQLQLLWTGEVDEGVPCRYGKRLHLWFLYVLRTTSPITLDPSELSEYRWLTLEAVSKIRRPTPAFRVILEHVHAEQLAGW
jgi:ADP-ribose pyrophosphatase YjhB (NUDIX family)